MLEAQTRPNPLAVALLWGECGGVVQQTLLHDDAKARAYGDLGDAHYRGAQLSLARTPSGVDDADTALTTMKYLLHDFHNLELTDLRRR